jgi:hypothetical protein
LATGVEEGGTVVDTPSETPVTGSVVGAMKDTEPIDSEAMDEGSDGGTLSMVEGINRRGDGNRPSSDLVKRRWGGKKTSP